MSAGNNNNAAAADGDDDASNESRRHGLHLTLDGDQLRRNARLHGLSENEGEILAELVQQQLRLAWDIGGHSATMVQVVEAIKQKAGEEAESESMNELGSLENAFELIRDMDNEELGEFLALGEGISMDKIQPCLGKRFLAMDNEEEEAVEIEGQRFNFDDDGLDDFFGPEEEPYGERRCAERRQRGTWLSFKHHGADLVSALCRHVELAVEIAKHLGPRDIVRLYSVNRSFRLSLDGHMLSSIRQIIGHSAPEAGRVFPFNIYRSLLVPDPSGRSWETTARTRPTQAEEEEGTEQQQQQQQQQQMMMMMMMMEQPVRSIPGLKYLQLVLGRDRYCRDILALLARHGLRHPPGTHKTLLRLWLLLDLSTSRQRRALLRNQKLWTDEDLYRAQMFLIKLSMLFNDPVFGPLEHDLPNLILGQRAGLFFLWKVLMRKALLTPYDMLEAKVRYDCDLPHSIYVRLRQRQQSTFVNVLGVPLEQVGIGHLEGWGKGREHLMRPDELIPHEAVVRGLGLDEHLVQMMCWGNFSWETGENLVPNEDEMYMSDDDRVLANIDTSSMWQRRHALKKRWHTLTPAQQKQIVDDDQDERLRALAWAAEHPLPITTEDERLLARISNAPAPPALDDEINRGCIIRPPESFCTPSPTSTRRRRHPCQPPALTDPPSAWRAFSNHVGVSLPPELDGDELLRAEMWNNYLGLENSAVEALDWDWPAWLKQERRLRAEAAAREEHVDRDRSPSDAMAVGGHDAEVGEVDPMNEDEDGDGDDDDVDGDEDGDRDDEDEDTEDEDDDDDDDDDEAAPSNGSHGYSYFTADNILMYSAADFEADSLLLDSLPSNFFSSSGPHH
ncbi:hypothetical protein XA68_17666 [Ophiocordyceps unilateralis]|uniref:Uncharacterized protein n=1 Tax=Ophiocordyceps unilateralis TaxID=268505 RepID=A0A2A9PJU6_OPHUN|nr:hypothetical protein XA68_17666 [Ophiocordyceps unilateralis]